MVSVLLELSQFRSCCVTLKGFAQVLHSRQTSWEWLSFLLPFINDAAENVGKNLQLDFRPWAVTDAPG
jgi:hypothetical protein